MTEVKIKQLKANAKIPTWGSVDSAGADLYACTEDLVTEIPPHETVMIPLGFATEFPKGHAAFIYARSGIASKRSLAPVNAVGVIDSDYRGEWMVPVHNYSSEVQIVEDGERICQVIFQEVEHPIFETTNDLGDTERSTGGFGSTGTK